MSKRTSAYYVLPVYGCTDPEPLVGPFDTQEEMLTAAIEVHAEQKEQDAIFWLVIEGGTPQIFSFTDEQLKTDYCPECRVKDHDVCSMTVGCPCCDDTIARQAK